MWHDWVFFGVVAQQKSCHYLTSKWTEDLDRSYSVWKYTFGYIRSSLIKIQLFFSINDLFPYFQPHSQERRMQKFGHSLPTIFLIKTDSLWLNNSIFKYFGRWERKSQLKVNGRIFNSIQEYEWTEWGAMRDTVWWPNQMYEIGNYSI